MSMLVSLIKAIISCIYVAGLSSKDDCSLQLWIGDGLVSVSCRLTETSNEFCSESCSSVRYDSRTEASFWCIENVDEQSYFIVSFPQLTAIAGIIFQCHHSASCSDSIFRLEYMIEHTDDQEFISYGLANVDYLDFMMSPNENIWLPERIKAVALKIVFVSGEKIYTRFDLFGCLPWLGEALGMVSGKISDDQLSGDTAASNLKGARLSTARLIGWTPSKLPGMYLQIDFEHTYRLTSMQIQQYFKDEGTDSNLLSFYLSVDEEIYQEDSEDKLFKAGNDSAMGDRHVFQRRILTHKLKVVPLASSPTEPFPSLKFEFYGLPNETPIHHWKLSDLSLEDSISLISFQNRSASLKTLPFLRDSCSVNPHYCQNDLLLSFFAKVESLPSLPWVSVTPDDVNLVECSAGRGGNVLFIHFSSFPTSIMHAAELGTQNTLFGYSDDELYDIRLYSGRNESLEVTCSLEDDGFIAWNFSQATANDFEGVSFELFQEVLKKSMNSHNWQYGQSFSIKVRSYNPISNTLTLPSAMFFRYKISKKGYEHLENLTNDLPGDSFRGNSKCPSSEFSNLAINSQTPMSVRSVCIFIINLRQLRTISMIKVRGALTGYVKQFALHHSKDCSSPWIQVNNNEGLIMKFEKWNNGLEYLPLISPISASCWKIVPNSLAGTDPKLQVDFVAQINQGFSQARSIKKVSGNGLDSMDGELKYLMERRYYYTIDAEYRDESLSTMCDSKLKYRLGIEFCLDKHGTVLQRLGQHAPYNAPSPSFVGAACKDFEVTPTTASCLSKSKNILLSKDITPVCNWVQMLPRDYGKLNVGLAVSQDHCFRECNGHRTHDPQVMGAVYYPQRHRCYCTRYINGLESSSDYVTCIFDHKYDYKREVVLEGLVNATRYNVFANKLGLRIALKVMFMYTPSTLVYMLHIMCGERSVINFVRYPNFNFHYYGWTDPISELAGNRWFGLSANVLYDIVFQEVFYQGGYYFEVYLNGILQGRYPINPTYCEAYNIIIEATLPFVVMSDLHVTTGIFDGAQNSMVEITDHCLPEFDIETEQACQQQVESYLPNSKWGFQALNSDTHRPYCSYNRIFKSYIWNRIQEPADDVNLDENRLSICLTKWWESLDSDIEQILEHKDSNKLYLLKGSTLYEYDTVLQLTSQPIVHNCTIAFVTNDHTPICVAYNHVYMLLADQWKLVYSGSDVKLVSGSGRNLFVYDHPHIKHMFSRPLFNSGQEEEHPLFNTGLSTGEQFAEGTGFEVSLTPSGMVITVASTHTFARLKATFNHNEGEYNWRQYTVHWNGDFLALYRDLKVVDRVNVIKEYDASTPLEWANRLVMGGWVYGVYELHPGVQVRNVKIWSGSFSYDEITSLALQDLHKPTAANINQAPVNAVLLSKECGKSLPCPYLLLNDPVFFVSGEAGGFNKGRVQCQMSGADLASLLTPEQVQTVSRNFVEEELYIGWMKGWVDETYSSFSHEVDQEGSTMCRAIGSNFNDLSDLSDVACTKPLKPLCKASGYLSRKVFFPAETISNECENVSAYQDQPEFTLGGSDQSSIAFTFVNVKVPGSVENARLTFTSILDRTIKVGVAVINSTCFDRKTTERDFIEWNIDQFISPDIADLLAGYSDQFSVVLFWEMQQEIEIREISLILNYYPQTDRFAQMSGTEGLSSALTFSTEYVSLLVNKLTFNYAISGQGVVCAWKSSTHNATLIFCDNTDSQGEWTDKTVTVSNFIPSQILLLAYPFYGETVRIHSIKSYYDPDLNVVELDPEMPSVEEVANEASENLAPVIVQAFTNRLEFSDYFLEEPDLIFTTNKYNMPYQAFGFASTPQSVEGYMSPEGPDKLDTFTASIHVHATRAHFHLFTLGGVFMCEIGAQQTLDIYITLETKWDTMVYESSEQINLNQWVYLVLIYNSEKQLEAYFDHQKWTNKLESVNISKIMPLKGKANLFDSLLDPTDVWRSCFQLFQYPLTPALMKTHELCLHLSNESICPGCFNDGFCIPFVKFCECGDLSAMRYINQLNCDSVLPTYRDNTEKIVHFNFDKPSQVAMVTGDKSDRVQSIINYGACAIENDVNIIDEEFTFYMNFTFSSWIRINSSAIAEGQLAKVLQILGMQIYINKEKAVAKFVSESCLFSKNTPLDAWFYFYIYFEYGKTVVIINHKIIETLDNCVIDLVSSGIVFSPGTCFDEVIAARDTHVESNYYFNVNTKIGTLNPRIYFEISSKDFSMVENPSTDEISKTFKNALLSYIRSVVEFEIYTMVKRAIHVHKIDQTGSKWVTLISIKADQFVKNIHFKELQHQFTANYRAFDLSFNNIGEVDLEPPEFELVQNHTQAYIYVQKMEYFAKHTHFKCVRVIKTIRSTNTGELIKKTQKLYYSIPPLIDTTAYTTYELEVYIAYHQGYSTPAYLNYTTPYYAVNELAAENFTTMAINERNVTLTWAEFPMKNYRAPSLFAYLINVSDVTKRTVNGRSIHNQSVLLISTSVANSTNVTAVKGLLPFTFYNITLSTLNDMGEGAWTEISITTLPDVPGSVHNISATYEAPSYTISWPRLLLTEVNSHKLLDYVVNVRSAIDAQAAPDDLCLVSMTSSMLGNNFMLPECLPYQFVEVSVYAENDVGLSIATTVCLLMPEGVPMGQVEHIWVEELMGEKGNHSSVNVTTGGMEVWLQQSVITYYQINITSPYHTFLYNVSLQPNVTFQPPFVNCSVANNTWPSTASVANLTVEELYHYVEYTFTVVAGSKVGFGAEETSVKFTTAPYYPQCNPQNLTMFNLSATELLLTFSPVEPPCLNGDLQYYVIFLLETEIYDDLQKDNKNDSGIVDSTYYDQLNSSSGASVQTVSLEHTFTELEENRNYTCVLFVRNHFGDGPLSQHVTQATNDAPISGSPQNLTANTTALPSNSDYVQTNVLWQEIDEYELNGEFHHYILIAVGLLSNGSLHNITLNCLQTQAELLLYPATNYTIDVQGVSRFGAGPSQTLQIVTIEIPPKHGAHDMLVNTSETAANLTWRNIDPMEANGFLIELQVEVIGILPNSQVSYENFSLALDLTELHVDDLHHGVVYMFNITVCNMAGCSPPSTVQNQTKDVAPSASVGNVTAINVSTTTACIHWQPVPPMQRGGEITHTVTLTAHLHPWQVDDPQNVVNQTGDMLLMVTGLHGHTTYHVLVVPFTSAGKGPQAEYTFTTLDDVPCCAPTKVSTRALSSLSLLVWWTIVPPRHARGIITHYNVSFNVTRPTPRAQIGLLSGYRISRDVSVELTNVSLAAMVTLTVAGCTVAGCGKHSDVIYQQLDHFVDGNWTLWTDWGMCSKSCGRGILKRYRYCSNPYPLNGGFSCQGPDQEWKHCNDHPCSGIYLAPPSLSCKEHCESLDEGNFFCSPFMDIANSSSAFKEVYDGSDYTRPANFTCRNTNSVYSQPVHPSYTGEGECQGFQQLPTKVNCEAKETKVRRLCSCGHPVSILFSAWTSWGLMCSKKCGVGTRSRKRECVAPQGCPSGESLQMQDCNTHPCPVSGAWGAWGLFKNCSVECGYGSRTRRRKCENPHPQFGGDQCTGISEDTIQGCNAHVCPVDGSWSRWKSMGECNRPCGTRSFRIEKRLCDNPTPENGGRECVGSNERAFRCTHLKLCPKVKYDFTVHLIGEKWHYMMYQMKHPFSVNLTRRLEQNIRNAYTNSSIALINNVNFTIQVYKYRRGSVNAHFGIVYDEVASVEALHLQQIIENTGYLGDMPLRLTSINASLVPNEPPQDVVAVSNTLTTIDVEWTNSTANSLCYVYCKKASNLEWTVYATRELHYKLLYLSTYTFYEIRVLRANEYGMGVASPNLLVRTKEGVPRIAPPNVNYQILNYDTVYFGWDFIPPEEVSGHLIGYELRIRKYFSNITRTAVAYSNYFGITLQMFSGAQHYIVDVAGFTNTGRGPKVSLTFFTPPGPPKIAPPNLRTVDYYSWDSIRVQWDGIPEHQQNGRMDGYILTYLLTHTADVEVVGEDTKILFLDRYTNLYILTDLKPYSQYFIQVFGYSNAGNGPKAIATAKTCTCPEYIFSNWYEKKPIVYKNDVGKMRGLFPNFFEQMIRTVCSKCQAYEKNVFSFANSKFGEPSQKQNEKQVRNAIEGGGAVHLNFPVRQRFYIEHFIGKWPYIGVIPSQGSAILIYKPFVLSLGLRSVLLGVLCSWPVVAIAVLMTAVTAILIWMTEQFSPETDINRKSFIRGAAEGFWLAYVTMTTIGYGDYIVYSKMTRIIMFFWTMTGMIITCIFCAAVSSSMSVSSQPKHYIMYGSEISVVENSDEHRTAIIRNAMIRYTRANASSVITDVAKGRVEMGLVDVLCLVGKEKEMEDQNIQVYGVLGMDDGYGVVLSSELTSLEQDFRSYVAAKSQDLIEMSKEYSQIQASTKEIKVLLFSEDEVSIMFKYLAIAFAALCLLGLLKSRCNQNKVKPHITEERVLCDFKQLSRDVIRKARGIKSSLTSLYMDHEEELFELWQLKRNWNAYRTRENGYVTQENYSLSYALAHNQNYVNTTAIVLKH